jgi:flagellum-specific ATP synthase
VERSPQQRTRIDNALERLQQRAEIDSEPVIKGRLKRMVGLTLEAVGCEAPLGGRCTVELEDGSTAEAEVVGFNDESLFLMPVGEIHGVTQGAHVVPTSKQFQIPVGDGLLGRVIDGAGKPIDGKGEIEAFEHRSLNGKPVNPLNRSIIHEPLDVGIRAINSLLTVGKGQRIGLFAGSGVGKSVLLGMMTQSTTADVVVVGLIGERGREVQEFIQKILGEEGMRRAVVIATPADDSPLMRMHGAMLTHTIAEYFRDQGKDVLMLMDSLTRFAMAQREIGLSVGEPPATKGYPPSVFAKLPKLVERAGMGGKKGGSITAFYTVLVEGGDHDEPIADAARGILDGHFVLSREIAGSGRYPAIDIESSVSRVMNDIVSPEHEQLARHFRQIYGRYTQNEDLISVGAYQQGSDQRIDEAIQYYPLMNEYLHQNRGEAADIATSITLLVQLFQSQQGATAG